MKLVPTHASRSPYIFHFGERSVALGEPRFLNIIAHNLKEQGYHPQITYWDQVYLAQLDDDIEGNKPQLIEESSRMQEMMNSVGVELTEDEFWSALESPLFDQMSWPAQGEELLMPEVPGWMSHARSWFFDPVAPAQGTGNIGGWVRTRGRERAGQPVGLFQLTDPDSFWVLGSADDLERVHQLCLDLAHYRDGFEKTTAYLGYDLRMSSIALPMICRGALEEEFYLAGVDTESLFWE
ncbi:hypothetical protein [Rothia sp. ZJ932]|uniref:hypothetical protein n=1 Tax=Rothia sp. ZJ932 TaxID=2810516 RepID=UPI001967C1CA|nr:hypothetical protein [Rothia sp. ZJ932]QRZ61744.1 hypothetical protein JR346_00950 [Rothia sp. ZJ932]